MPNLIENLGLESMAETEDDALQLLRIVARCGKPITGYYGYPYINMNLGDAEFIARTEIDATDGSCHVIGFDTHSSGNCVWKARINGLTNPKEAEKTQCRCILKRSEDGCGMAVVNIINADVLPSFLDDEEITLQMIAFALTIDYYPDEDAYADSQPDWEDGKKWLIADGSIFPTGFMNNHDAQNPECEKDPRMDDYNLIRGTVKNVYWGVTEIGENKYNTYIRTVIETQFGDLELIHTEEQVNELQRKYIKKGCVVNGVFILSGDAAIYEYQKGYVLDEEHDLRALRYSLIAAEAERLRSIFCDDAVYISDESHAEYRGKEAVIERLSIVKKNTKCHYHAQMATVTSVDADADGGIAAEYAKGKRCVVLSEEELNNFTAIAFIDTDEKNMIKKLHITTDPRYHFSCDAIPEQRNPLEDAEPHKDVSEPILMRARFHGMIGDGISDEAVLSRTDEYSMYKESAENMLNALADNPQKDVEKAFENIFGYLFAKAIEYTWNSTYRKSKKTSGQLANYSLDDLFSGTVRTDLDEFAQKKIERAYGLGKQFYKDFRFYIAEIEPDDDRFSQILVRALIIVQQVGEMYTDKCLGA